MSYNYKNIKIKIGILIMLIFVFSQLLSTEANTEAGVEISAKNIVKKGFCNFATLYGTILTHTVIHECGHALPGYMVYKDPIKIFIGVDSKKQIEKFKSLIESDKSFIKFNFFKPYMGCCVINVSLRTNCFKIITSVGGPGLGILSSYLLLKSLNVLKYYEKHNDFKRALSLGFKETIFNSDGSDLDYKLGIKLGAVCSIFQELNNIFNVADKKIDGYHVLKDLKCSENVFKILTKVPFRACFVFSRNLIIVKITLESLLS